MRFARRLLSFKYFWQVVKQFFNCEATTKLDLWFLKLCCVVQIRLKICFQSVICRTKWSAWSFCKEKEKKLDLRFECKQDVLGEDCLNVHWNSGFCFPNFIKLSSEYGFTILYTRALKSSAYWFTLKLSYEYEFTILYIRAFN